MRRRHGVAWTASCAIALCLMSGATAARADLFVAAPYTPLPHPMSVNRYDENTGAYLESIPVAGEVSLGVAVGPDHQLYSTGDDLGLGGVWRATGPHPSFVVDSAPVGGMANHGYASPEGITFGPDGNMYVASNFNPPWPGSVSGVLEYATDGTYLGQVASVPAPGFFVYDLTFGPSGDLFFSAGPTVKRANRATHAVSDFVAAGSGGLGAPFGVTFGPDGNLYVADSAGNDVLRYDGTTGAPLGTFVASGIGGLNHPLDLEFGPDHNLYVLGAAARNNSVLRYNGTTGAFMDAFVPPTGIGEVGPSSEFLTFGSIPEPGVFVMSSAAIVMVVSSRRYRGAGAGRA